MYDYHVHSNYSDGRFLVQMLAAAERAGLAGIGFADHCAVGERPLPRRSRAVYGYNLDRTYERRRRAIRDLGGEFDVTVYDAVEMDYDPRDEAAIAAFLDEAAFDYAVGSVHYLDGDNVQFDEKFADRPDAELDRLVDRYFDTLVALIESELFDVAAHPDLIERSEPFAGRATERHYRRAAAAFADSRTVPEVNLGRALTERELIHPNEDFLAALREYDVSLTVGTDAHAPDELTDRVPFVREWFADRAFDPVAPPSLR